MLQRGIQKRKTRNFLRRITFSLGIFIVTFIICFGIYGFFFLKKSGIVSPITSGGIQKSMIGDETSQQINDIKRFCDEQKLSCSNVSDVNSTITITLSNDAQIFLSAEKDVPKQLSSLQLTLNQLTIEGKQFKKLDFRFDKITISF